MQITPYGTPWGKLVDEGPGCPPTLQEYGLLTLLSTTPGSVRTDYPKWGRSDFSSHDPVWGVELTWPKALAAGFAYVFQFKFERLPDVILLNGALLWNRLTGEAPNGRVLFRYIPEKTEDAVISFLRHRDYNTGATSENLYFDMLAACHQLQVRPAAIPHYERPVWYRTLLRSALPALMKNFDYQTSPLYDVPPAVVRDQRSGMKVEIFHETLEAYLPNAPTRLTELAPEQTQFLVDLVPILDAQGFDGMMLYHSDPALIEALRRSRLRRFIVEVGSLGDHWLCRNGNYIQRPRFEAGITLVNALLTAMSDAQIYIWFPELEDREYNYFQSPAFEEARRLDEASSAVYGVSSYTDLSDNEFWREKTLNAAHLEWKKAMWQRFSDPGRVRAIYQSANPFAIAHFQASGCDLTVCKAIFRDSFNVVLASARGTARAHHQKMGVDYDPWSWQIRMNHAPDEWRQGLKLYLHSGCEVLFHEGTLFRRDATDGRLKPTANGLALLEAVGYARRHPPVGTTEVRLAAMHGSGECDPIILPRFKPQLPLDGNPQDWIPLRYRDYGLLDVFFPELGSYMSGNIHRLMTGTPYGPLDVVPFDCDLEALRNYRVLVLLGSNGCDATQKNVLEAYVQQGGTLVFALGQLRGKECNPRRYCATDFSCLGGFTIDPESERLTVQNAEVIAEFPGGVQILRHTYGKGRSYCVTSGTLTTCAAPAIRQLLHQLAQPERMLELSPESDFVEYIPCRCGGKTWSITFFHHGQIGFPSGLGPKAAPWHGVCALSRAQMDLQDDACDWAVFTVADGCRLQAHPFEITPESINIDLTIDPITELVVGPRAVCEQSWRMPHPENDRTPNNKQ